MSTPPSPPRVRAGQLVALRLFDVAYSIDLGAAEAGCTAQSVAASSRGSLTTTPAKALAFAVPPLRLRLDPVQLTLGTLRVDAQVEARLYDFGIVSLALRVPVLELDWPDFAKALEQLDRAAGHAAPAETWDSLLGRVRALIAPALVRPSASALSEDYLLAIVNALEEPCSADDLLARVDVAGLLSGETRPLSEQTRRELLRQRFSWFTDDVVVLTFDRAFLLEPRGDTDVADVIDVANAQLLELRYYNDQLDAELPQMYQRVGEARRAISLFAARRFAHLARRLYTLVAEVTEVTEKVDNALKVTEDVYLARVYSAALDTLRVPTIGASVDSKLAIMRDTYMALHEEASSRRAELLEVMIIVLIMIEIVMGWPGGD